MSVLNDAPVSPAAGEPEEGLKNHQNSPVGSVGSGVRGNGDFPVKHPPPVAVYSATL